MAFKISVTPFVTVIVLATLDAEFRAKLVKNPSTAVSNLGVKLTTAQMKALAELDVAKWDDTKLKDLNDRLTKAKAFGPIGGGIDSGSAIGH